MRSVFACAALLAATLSAPTSAANYLITVQGTAFAVVPPGGTPIPEIAALNGVGLFSQFLVNADLATYNNFGPIGGQGTSAGWTGAVQGGYLLLGGTVLTSNANDLGTIFLINNGGVPSNPNVRLDQATINSGARFVNNALVKSYDIFGLPSDIYLQSLAFGRTQTAPTATPPDLVTDPTIRPDFPSYLFAPGTPGPFLSLNFRRGNPTSAQQQATLPVHQLAFSISALNVETITGVPEPSSWAMLIIGFGLTGAVMRRRAVQAA